MDVLGSLVDGSLPPASLLDCELPAYGFAATLTEGALEPDDWAGLRTDLLSRIDTGSFDIDPVQARIEQGYAAADYAATAFMLCQADQRCFENLLETDELVDRICPNPVPNGFDDTSPDFFELNLFYYGSDMRHFLPYLLTNCRLLSASDVDDELRPIFDTLMQALRMR